MQYFFVYDYIECSLEDESNEQHESREIESSSDVSEDLN